MSNYEIPYWKKYKLSIEEAASYFRIGEGKLRKMVSENPSAEYLLWNGNRVQIKREKFEAFVDALSAVQRGFDGLNTGVSMWVGSGKSTCGMI